MKITEMLSDVAGRIVGHLGTITRVAIGIFVLSILLWWSAIPAPFVLILVAVALIIGLPHAWEMFGKGSIVWKFWGGVLGKGGRGVLLVGLYLTLRGTIAYLVRYPLASSGGQLDNTPLVTAIGFIHPSLLFEVCFAFVIGGTIYLWLFAGKGWAKTATASIMVTLLLGVTWYLAVGPRVVTASTSPISSYGMSTAVGENGVIGGTIKQLWVFCFGAGDADASDTILEVRPFVLPTSETNLLLESGAMSEFMQSPTGKLEIESTDGGWNFLTLDGRLIRSYERANWPTNEPFRIVTITSQRLKIAVL